MGKDRAARIDELCKVDGPLTVDEARELNRLAAEERFERNWRIQLDEEG